MSIQPTSEPSNRFITFFEKISKYIHPKPILIATGIIAVSAIITAIALKALGYSNIAVAIATAIPITFSAAIWLGIGILIVAAVVILIAWKIFHKKKV